MTTKELKDILINWQWIKNEGSSFFEYRNSVCQGKDYYMFFRFFEGAKYEVHLCFGKYWGIVIPITTYSLDEKFLGNLLQDIGLALETNGSFRGRDIGISNEIYDEIEVRNVILTEKLSNIKNIDKLLFISFLKPKPLRKLYELLYDFTITINVIDDCLEYVIENKNHKITLLEDNNFQYNLKVETKDYIFNNFTTWNNKIVKRCLEAALVGNPIMLK